MKYERLRAEVVPVEDVPEMIYEPVRGVLVRGMEMPKSCFECRFRYYDREARMVCELTGRSQHDERLVPDREKRPGWCPLVEVLN